MKEIFHHPWMLGYEPIFKIKIDEYVYLPKKSKKNKKKKKNKSKKNKTSQKPKIQTEGIEAGNAISPISGDHINLEEKKEEYQK